MGVMREGTEPFPIEPRRTVFRRRSGPADARRSPRLAAAELRVRAEPASYN